MTAVPIDPARWQRLSPLLDALLDLEGAVRAERLAVLRADDPSLADDLQALLAHDDAAAGAGAGAGLLDTPALPAGLARALASQVAADAAALADPQPGQPLGPYTLDREIGRGGMGSVWRAQRSDGRFQGQVAVKFLQAGLGSGRSAGRFAREGQILARLAHPHIARLLDAGVDDRGRGPYLVLEYVDGQPIDAWCGERALPPEAAVRLLLDVLDAVAHAHTRLILHRDLKPSNILVTTGGEVKLLDFGIARLLHDGAASGTGTGAAATPPTELTQHLGGAYTPAFAAPEQVQGGEVSTATDVYALGVLMYGLFGGGHPTSPGPTTPVARLRDIVEAPPKRLSDAVRAAGGADAGRRARRLRGDLDAIVARALKKAPHERYPHAGALADDLRRWLAHEPIAARPDSNAYRAAMFARRHRLGVAAAVLLAATLAAGLTATLWQAREANRQREQAEGLIEFMLGDLYGRLEPVGRLDVLDAVARRTLAHYDAQPAALRDTDAQRRRARALRVLGRVTHRGGHLDDGIALMRQSLALTEAGLQRAPDDVRWLAEQAGTLRELHFLLREAGDQAGMAQVLPRQIAATQRLMARQPDAPGARRDLAAAFEQLGMQELDAEHLPVARSAFEQGAALLEAATLRDNGWRTALGDLHGWLSRVHELQDDLDGAVAQMQRKLDLLTAPPTASGVTPAAASAAAESNDDVPLRNAIAHAHGELGRLAIVTGEVAQAQQHLRAGLALADALVQRDGENLEWRAQRMALAVNLADALVDGPTRLAEAEAYRQVAARDLRLILQREGGNPFWSIVHAGKQLRLQAALAQAGRQTPAPTLAELQAPLDAAARHEATGRRIEPLEQRSLAGVRLPLGEALRAAGRADEARAQWRLALATLDSPAHRTQPLASAMRTRVLLRLGELAAAREALAVVERAYPRWAGGVALRRELAAAGG